MLQLLHVPGRPDLWVADVFEVASRSLVRRGGHIRRDRAALPVLLGPHSLLRASGNLLSGICFYGTRILFGADKCLAVA